MPQTARQRGISRFEIMAATGVLTVVALGLFVATRPSLTSDDSTMDRSVEPIATALSAWRESHPNECPTLGLLEQSGFLDPERTSVDPWGSRFRVACEGEKLSIVSPGPDGKLNTKDDVRVPVG